MTVSDKKREIYGLFYLAAAIFFTVIFYVPAGRTGWLGGFVRSSGLGLFGTAAFALPAVLLYMSLDYFLESRLKLTRQRFTAVIMLWLSFTVLAALLATQQDQLRIDAAESARKAIQVLWAHGIEIYDPAGAFRFSGGLTGGLAASGLRALIGQTGALIFVLVMILALLVLIFNLSVSKFIFKTATTINKTQGKVQQVMKQQVNDLRQHREIRQQQPQIRRIDSADYDLQLPTSWQPTEPVRKKGLYKPDAESFEDDYIDDTLLDESIYARPESFAKVGNDNNVDDVVQDDNSWAASSWLDLPENDPLFSDDGISSDADIGSGAIDEPNVTSDIEFAMPAQNKSTGQRQPVVHHAHGHPSMEQQSLPYTPPSLELLKDDTQQRKVQMHAGAIRALGRKLEQTLESFKVQAKVVNFTTGPTITRFELTPGPGVKVSKIVNLADDIALNLAAMGVRIEAPIPGKAAIGIEIPNKETTPVLLRSLLESQEFIQAKSPLTAALGRDVQGNPIFCDLAKMPHLLIAGATGSGKSVCINCILMSLLYKATPDQVKLLMIDPKVVELSVYNGIPHLIQPVVTDPKKAYGVLNWAVDEMVRRYSLFADRSVRDIASYNAALDLDQEDESERLPLILLVIDELSDLMATTPTEVEDAIARLTAMARAAGIHMIIATQRPSVDVITGVIKANIPSRIAFAVASQIDSRTIIDMGGAEKLLGKGDLLYYPQSASKPLRGQGAFITDSEVEKVLHTIKSNYTPDYDDNVAEAIASIPDAKNAKDDRSSPGEQDELLPQALSIVVETGYASVSLLQRKMTVGYPRAARLIDRLHEMGYIGPFEGSKPRKVLLSMSQYMDLQQKEDTEK